MFSQYESKKVINPFNRVILDLPVLHDRTAYGYAHTKTLHIALADPCLLCLGWG